MKATVFCCLGAEDMESSENDLKDQVLRINVRTLMVLLDHLESRGLISKSAVIDQARTELKNEALGSTGDSSRR